jgi:hypothetical protein
VAISAQVSQQGCVANGVGHVAQEHLVSQQPLGTAEDVLPESLQATLGSILPSDPGTLHPLCTAEVAKHPNGTQPATRSAAIKPVQHGTAVEGREADVGLLWLGCSLHTMEMLWARPLGLPLLEQNSPQQWVRAAPRRTCSLCPINSSGC